MPQDIDPEFYDRADAHIHLSNDQLSGLEEKGQVSASMMYATARFNSWVSACGFTSGKDMAEAKAETLEYFTNQYRLMLEENLDEYIANFASHMQVKE